MYRENRLDTQEDPEMVMHDHDHPLKYVAEYVSTSCHLTFPDENHLKREIEMHQCRSMAASLTGVQPPS